MSLVPESDPGPDVIPATALVLKKLELLDAQRKTYKRLLEVCYDRDEANGTPTRPAKTGGATTVPAAEPASNVTDATEAPAE